MEAGIGIAGILMIVVLIAAGITSLVCWIMTLIKIFKDSVGLGILGIICSLFAFIYGWIKCKEYDNKKIMTIWTIAFLLSIVFQLIFSAMAGAASINAANELQQMNMGN